MHAARSSIAGLALLVGLAALSNSQAQDYPNRPVRFIVNTAIGGTVDVTARVVAQSLTESLGKAVVVENRDGGGGVIGAAAVAKATPDGYTLLYCSAGITSFAALQKNLPFSPATDLVPVVPVVSLPFVFVTPPGSPYKTLSEFMTQAKKAPGTLTIASGGNGTFGHLLGAWLKSEAGVDLIHVPYRGAAPALQALLGGQVVLYPDPIPTAAPLVNSGKIRALAISSSRRSPLLPDTPTLVESGYPVHGVTWFGILAPAAVPKDIVARMNEEVNKLLPKLRPSWEASGYFVEGGSVADFGKRFTTESATWAKLIAEAGIKVDN
jgi:tripartite-type tricarboxylate transporter receptor subunit TctC